MITLSSFYEDLTIKYVQEIYFYDFLKINSFHTGNFVNSKVCNNHQLSVNKYTWHIVLRLPRNSEASASEYLYSLEMSPWIYCTIAIHSYNCNCNSLSYYLLCEGWNNFHTAICQRTTVLPEMGKHLFEIFLKFWSFRFT